MSEYTYATLWCWPALADERRGQDRPLTAAHLPAKLRWRRRTVAVLLEECERRGLAARVGARWWTLGPTNPLEYQPLLPAAPRRWTVESLRQAGYALSEPVHGRRVLVPLTRRRVLLLRL